MKLAEQPPLALDTVLLQERHFELTHQLDVLTLYKAVLSYKSNPLADRDAVDREMDDYLPGFEYAAYEADEGHNVDLNLAPDGVRFAHRIITQYIDMGEQEQRIEQMEAFRRNLEETVATRRGDSSIKGSAMINSL